MNLNNQNSNKTVIFLTAVIYYPFFPVFWLIKTIKKLSFEIKKANAIRDAEQSKSENGKRIHVMQHGSQFIHGSRKYLRSLNTREKKKLRGTGLTFNYKKAIIHTAK